MLKVKIRYQKISEAEDFFRILNNPNFKYFESQPKTLQDEIKWLKQNRQKIKDNIEHNYTIFYNNKLVGAIGIKIKTKSNVISTGSANEAESGEIPPFSNQKRIGEIGYFIDEKYWGKGIAVEAIKLAEKIAFRKLGLDKIEIIMQCRNKSSEKVAIKSGYVKKKKVKNGVTSKDGKKYDAYVYEKFSLHKTVQNIFKKYKLNSPKNITKINIGWSNDVYSIDDKYILKISKYPANELDLTKEAWLFKYFKNKLCVPKVIAYDDSKNIYYKNYLIYRKIKGDNLYSRWHLLSNKQRREIVQQLCSLLKKINQAPYNQFSKVFSLDSQINWQKEIIGSIKRSLVQASKRKLLSPGLVKKINEFIAKNKLALKEQKIGLVYFDAHFDNILVRGSKIVGLLDLERTKIASIDFALDIIKRMVDIPQKYMSEQSEKYCKQKDYSQLLVWFKEFYPELFNFFNMDKRLTFYDLEHDLKDLLDFPNTKPLKKLIAKHVNYRMN